MITGIRPDQEPYQFKIDELYIPLKTTIAQANKKTTKNKKEAETPGKVNLDQILSEKRTIIIGDPGAGKTTFLKRTAYTVIGKSIGITEAYKNESSQLKNQFPLFIRLEDVSVFIQQCRKRHKRDCPVTDTDPSWFLAFLIDSSQALSLDLTPGSFNFQPES